MYICICNGITDHALRAVVRAGARCPHSAYAALGGEPRCGTCLEFAKSLIEEANGEDGRALPGERAR